MPRKYVCPSCKAEAEIEDQTGPPATPETARFDVQGKFSEYDERLARLEHPAPPASTESNDNGNDDDDEPKQEGFFAKLNRILDDDD